MGTTSAPDALTPPPGNPRFPAIDALRALAAVSVVVFHAEQFSHSSGSVLGRVTDHLDVGVAVFFAITGFLLYRPFVAAGVGDAPLTPMRAFYWRRVLRLIPAYWVALVVMLPLIRLGQPHGLPNLLLIQAYRSSWARSGIAPAWSICVEASFYLLLPLFALLLRRLPGLSRAAILRRDLGIIAALYVLGLLARLAIHRASPDPYLVEVLPGSLAWFCGGMALAVLSVDRRAHAVRRVAAHRRWALWMTALVLYAVVDLTTQDDPDVSLVVFVTYGLIAVLLLAPLVFGELRPGRVLSWLGLISYGIYLYHYPIMGNVHFRTGSATVNLLLYLVLGLGTGIVGGGLSYYIIERPALKLKNLHEHPRVRRLLGLSSQVA
jgi:peptidoglycan/LPS O-acetylase OafA/YrhL